MNESGVRLLGVKGRGLEEDGPNVAVVELAKSDPKTVTLCPPPPGPEDGVSDETVGAAKVYRAMYVSQQLFGVGQPASPLLSSDTTQQDAAEDAAGEARGAQVIRCQDQVRCSIDQRLAEAGRQGDVAQVPDAGIAPQPHAKGHERNHLNAENPR